MIGDNLESDTYWGFDVLLVQFYLHFDKIAINQLDSIGYGLFCAWIHYYYF